MDNKSRLCYYFLRTFINFDAVRIYKLTAIITPMVIITEIKLRLRHQNEEHRKDFSRKEKRYMGDSSNKAIFLHLFTC